MTRRSPKPGLPSSSLKALDVEPLSDLAWQRIERNLMAALDREDPAPTRVAPAPRRRPALRWAAASMLAGAAAAAAVWMVSGADPTASGFRGPSRVVTAATPSTVSLGDVTLVVAPGSALLVDDERAGGVLIVLERGSVDCEVAPRGDRPPLTVQAGEVRVEVIGTHFAVSREGDAAAVSVFKGVVRVVARGELVLVAAGERWPRAIVASGGEAPADEADPPAPAGREPDRAPRQGHARDRKRHGGDKVAAPVEPSDKQRYEIAARLEATDAEAARAIYRQLATGAGSWAANALYAMARLEADLGNDARARDLLGSYLHRFPAGGNAGDARALLDRLGDR